MASILESRLGVVTTITPSARRMRSMTASGPNAENSGAMIAPRFRVPKMAK